MKRRSSKERARMNLNLPVETINKIKEVADSQNVTYSYLVEYVLNEFFSRTGPKKIA